MSQSRGGGTLKRRHDGVAKNLTDEERVVYDLIRNGRDMGISKADVRKELKLPNVRLVDSRLKTLLLRGMIKEVADIQSKGRKRLMATEFEPSKELTGGSWYDNGNLDNDLIFRLKKLIQRVLSQHKVATADGLCHKIKIMSGSKIDMKAGEVKEILDNMILDKEIIKVASNGMGEFAVFPINVDCYKLKPRQVKEAFFASIPCGVCPRISQCSPGGIISPATCEYYTKWRGDWSSSCSQGPSPKCSAQMFSDPNMAMDMMKKNLSMIIPQ